MGVWLKEPTVPHKCKRPAVMRGVVGGVWRCDCRRLWIYRTGWWFGDFPPWFQRTVPQWHRARWWEKLRWMRTRTAVKMELDSNQPLD